MTVYACISVVLINMILLVNEVPRARNHSLDPTSRIFVCFFGMDYFCAQLGVLAKLKKHIVLFSSGTERAGR